MGLVLTLECSSDAGEESYAEKEYNSCFVRLSLLFLRFLRMSVDECLTAKNRSQFLLRGSFTLGLNNDEKIKRRITLVMQYLIAPFTFR